jgi:hypothetical protein
MVHLVDTVEVEPGRLDEYLRAVEHLGVPVMTDAGASFVACATTAADLGEAITVQVTWSFSDHEQWNEIRRALVLDPRWHEYGGRLAALRTGGTRRFFHPVAFSPPPATAARPAPAPS